MALISEVVIKDSASAVLERVESALNRVTNAEGRLQDGTVKSTRTIETAARQFEQLKRSVDPAYDTMVRLADQQTKLNRAVSLGVASQAEANAVLAKFQQQSGQSVQGLGQMRGAMLGATQQSRAMQFAVSNLSFQINDVVTGLASGQDAFRVFTQQGGQFVQLFQQGSGVSAVLSAAGTAIRSMITPTTAAVAGVAALGGAFAVLLTRAGSNSEQLRRYNLILESTGRSAVTTAANLQNAARQLQALGMGRAEADAATQGLLRNPAFNAAAVGSGQVGVIGANVGAQLGISNEAGIERFTAAVQGGLDATLKLGFALQVLDASEASAIRDMGRRTSQLEAQNKAIEMMAGRLDDMRKKSLTPAADAINSISTAWSDMLSKLSDTAAVQGAQRAIISMLQGISKAAAGDFSGIVSGGASLPVIGGAFVAGGALVGGARKLWGQLPSLGDPAVNQRDLADALASRDGGLRSGGALAADFDARLERSLAAAVAAGLNVSRGSGFRSFDEQARLYALDPIGTARPGYSPHNLGMANDVRGARGLLTAAELQLFSPFLAAENLHAPLADWEKRREPWHIEPIEARGGVAARSKEQADAVAQSLARITKAREDDIAVAKKWNVEAEVERVYRSTLTRLNEEGAEPAEAERGATDAATATREKFNIELGKEITLQGMRIAGDLRIAEALRGSEEAANRVAAAEQARIEVMQKGGDVAQRTQEILDAHAAKAAISFQQAANDNSRQIDQLKLEASLQGETTDTVAVKLSHLQAIHRLQRDGVPLTSETAANYLRSADNLAQARVHLAEMERSQRRIDDLFRSIGDTIANSIGSVIEGIFDPSKAENWGKKLKSIFSSIAGQIAQSLVIRPLTGSILSMLGASANVVQQYGTLGGGSGGGFSLGNLSSAASLGNSFGLFDGFKLGGEGGLFSGVSDFFSGGLGGIFAHTPTAADFAAGVGPVLNAPGSIFGSTTFGQFAGGIGLGMGAGGLINSLMGGNSTFGTIGSGIGSILGSFIPIPIVGSLIGGALGGLFGGMFGNNRPRNASAGGNIDFSSGRVFDMFSGGNPQIDQATAQVIQQLGGFTQRLLALSGGKLSGEVLLQNGVNTGFTADSSLPGYEGRFNLGRDPAGAVRTVSLALARSLTDVSDVMRHVINQVSDPAKLDGAIQLAAAYDKIDEAFKAAFASLPNQQQVGPFAQAMEQIRAIFSDMTTKATEFGLALEPVTAGLAEAERRLRGDFTNLLNTALLEATGGGAVNQLHAVVASFYANMSEAAAINLGSDAGTTASITRLFEAQVNAVLSGLDAVQLAQVRDNFTGLNDAIITLSQSVIAAAAAMQPLIDLRTELTSGSLSGLTPANAVVAANDNFRNLLAMVTAGDASQIGALATAGQSALQYSLEAYGNAPQTAALRSEILAALDLLLAGAFASGTPSTPPGLILVGEKGPELIEQPGGLKVWSNPETEKIIAGMSFPASRSFANGTGAGWDTETKQLLREILSALYGNTRVTQGGLIATVGKLQEQIDEMRKPPLIEPQRSRFA